MSNRRFVTIAKHPRRPSGMGVLVIGKLRIPFTVIVALVVTVLASEVVYGFTLGIIHGEQMEDYYAPDWSYFAPFLWTLAGLAVLFFITSFIEFIHWILSEFSLAKEN